MTTYLDASISRVPLSLGPEGSFVSSLQPSGSEFVDAAPSHIISSPSRQGFQLPESVAVSPQQVAFGPYPQPMGQLVHAAEEAMRSEFMVNPMMVNQFGQPLQGSFSPYQSQNVTPRVANYSVYQAPRPVPVPCVPQEIAAAEFADEQRDLIEAIISGIVHGLGTHLHVSIHEKHTEVLEAIANTNVVVRPPDLSGILNVLGGISTAIKGVGDQVESQTKVLQALSRRMDLVEQTSRTSDVSLHFQELKAEFRSMSVQGGSAVCPRLQQEVVELNKKVQEQGQMMQKEIRELQAATSETLEQLLAQNFLQEATLEAMSCSVADKLRKTGVRADISNVHLESLAVTVQENVCLKVQDSDLETMSCSVVEKLQKSSVRTDFSPVLQELESLSSSVHNEIRSVSLKVNQSEPLAGLQAMHDQLTENVYQKMKKIAMKLETELLKDFESLAVGIAEAIDFSPVLDAIAHIDMKVIVKGPDEIGSPRAPCRSPSLDRQSKISTAEQSLRAARELRGGADRSQSTIRSGSASRVAFARSPSSPKRAASLDLNREGLGMGSTSREVTPGKDSKRLLACACGYTCGTREALDRHLTRFAGQRAHAAVTSR